MDEQEISTYFSALITEDPNMSEAVAAIRTLSHFIQTSKADTLTGLDKSLETAIEVLKSNKKKVASIASGCELFKKYISRTSKIEMQDFAEIKDEIVDRGHRFLSQAATSRQAIAELAYPFINDGAAILVHSRSRVVLEVLKRAAEDNRRFTVYVTESLPDKAGLQMYNDLVALEIPATIILDSAVAYIMEKIDRVIVGAECVVQSGGIINKIGTYTIAVCAKAMNKPLYVVAESVKFTQLFPLNQREVPNAFKYMHSSVSEETHPWVDYTPPDYITLLFTDLGILPPSAVCGELMKLYV